MRLIHQGRIQTTYNYQQITVVSLEATTKTYNRPCFDLLEETLRDSVTGASNFRLFTFVTGFLFFGGLTLKFKSGDCCCNRSRRIEDNERQRKGGNGAKQTRQQEVVPLSDSE